MSRSPGGLPAIVRRLSGAALPPSDADLLRRFAESHDEAAFEAIVTRHGPMVLDVCRGILHDWADVEDAFQAAFLVLARRAASVRDPDALGRWLCGVAARTARKARTRAGRRRRREATFPPPVPVEPVDPAWSEVQGILRDELSRMAERFRLPLELCYLAGRTQDEAASLLGLSKGTLRRRLERGRALLRDRLVRRGLGPVAVLLAAAWPSASVSGAAPPALVRATAAAAVKFASGDAAAVSSAVSSLTSGVLTAMSLAKLKSAAVTAALLVAALAAGAWGMHGRAGDEPRPDNPVPKSAKPEEPKVNPVAKQDAPTLRVQLAKGGPFSRSSIGFLDNDRVLVSPGTSKGLDVRDVKTGKVLKTVILDKHTLAGFRLSADRKWVAAETHAEVDLSVWGRPTLDHAVTVWDTATWKVRGTLDACRRLLDVGADGRTVAVLREDGIELWDVVGKKKLKGAPFAFNRIDAAALSPDGTVLAVSGLNEIAYWKWQDGDTYDRLKVGRTVVALAFSPDGKFVAEGPGPRMTVEVRDLTNLKVAQALSDPAQPRVPQEVRGMTFADEGRVLVAGNAVGLIETIPVPHRLNIWEVKTGKLKRQFAVPWGRPDSLDVSPDGTSLAVVVGGDGGLTLAVWNLAGD